MSRRMQWHELRDRPGLDALLKRSVAAYNAMTPEERREYDEAQRRSWGRGMAPCEHGIRDWETCPDCRKKQEPKP